MIFLYSCYLPKALVYQKVGIEDYKIFKNRTIETGVHQPWEIAENFNKIDIPENYKSEFEELETIAFLIIKDNKILHEEYWDGFSENSLSNSFSAAKSIVGLLIGTAIDDGKIKSVDQKVGDFLPEFKDGDNSKLTIKHLLTMSSGLNWHESYGSPFSKTTRAYYGKNLEKLVLDLKVIETPGVDFKYLSSCTELLALVVQSATGKTISEYMSEKFWKPLGAENEAIWCLDKEDGMEKAYCCFNSNARDFARFGQMCLDNGKWNGKQLISEKYLKESFTPASHLKSNGKPLDFYGYHWWILNHKGLKINYARGILGQYILMIPEKNMVIVRLGHKRSKERINWLPADIYTWIDTALEIESQN